MYPTPRGQWTLYNYNAHMPNKHTMMSQELMNQNVTETGYSDFQNYVESFQMIFIAPQLS
jgi:hypothetical protein